MLHSAVLCLWQCHTVRELSVTAVLFVTELSVKVFYCYRTVCECCTVTELSVRALYCYRTVRDSVALLQNWRQKGSAFNVF